MAETRLFINHRGRVEGLESYFYQWYLFSNNKHKRKRKVTRGEIYGSTLSIEEYVNNYYITSQRLLVNVQSLEESLMFNKPHIHFEITGDPFNLIGSHWCKLFTNCTILCSK